MGRKKASRARPRRVRSTAVRPGMPDDVSPAPIFRMPRNAWLILIAVSLIFLWWSVGGFSGSTLSRGHGWSEKWEQETRGQADGFVAAEERGDTDAALRRWSGQVDAAFVAWVDAIDLTACAAVTRKEAFYSPNRVDWLIQIRYAKACAIDENGARHNNIDVSGTTARISFLKVGD